MKKIFACLIIVGLFVSCQDGSNMDRFVGRWLSTYDNRSTLDFKDSSHVVYYKADDGSTAIGTYTFTDTTISFNVQFDDMDRPSSITQRYLLSDDYLDIMGLTPDSGKSIGLESRWIKQ